MNFLNPETKKFKEIKVFEFILRKRIYSHEKIYARIYSLFSLFIFTHLKEYYQNSLYYNH